MDKILRPQVHQVSLKSMKRIILRCIPAGLLLLPLLHLLWAYQRIYVPAEYDKFEYRIPMRDGKRLFTAVYVPKDLSSTYPIMLTRTPISASSMAAIFEI